MPMNITGWNDPMVLRGLSGSVPSDSTFASYHKAPGSEREYAQVKALLSYPSSSFHDICQSDIYCGLLKMSYVTLSLDLSVCYIFADVFQASVVPVD